MQKFNDIYAQFLELSNTRSFAQACEHSKTILMIRDFERYVNYIEKEKLQDNSLFVSKLHDKYIDLSFQVFSFSADEHLKNLFALFEQAFPDSARQIKKYWNVYSFSNGNKHILLKGDIQSGKTAMMILTALCHLVCEKDVVILLRTSNDDKIQFIERFKEIVEVIQRMGYTNKNFQTVDVADRLNIQSNTKYCFVSIYYTGKKGGHIKKLQNILQARGNNFAMYVDEADQRDDQKDIDFLKLRELCSTSIFVSGTVQDILVSNFGIQGANLVQLDADPNYKGIPDVNWITDWDVSTDDGVYWSLCDIAKDSWSDEYSYHPKIILVTTSIKIKLLTYYYKKFQKRDNFLMEGYPLPKELEGLCVIKYGDKGIRLYHESFVDLVIDDPEFKPTHNRYELAFGQNSGMTIKKVLLWLARNGGKSRFPTIVIMAGKKADRGINFACYDSHDYRNNWHVTHQILHKLSVNTKSAILLQSLRILGKYYDEIPLKVYTSEEEKNTIINTYNLTNKLYNCITDEDDEFYKNDFKRLTTDAICKKLPIKKKSISSNFIKKSIRNSFNLVSDYENGIDISGEEYSEPENFDLSEEEATKLYETIHNSLSGHRTSKQNIFLSQIDPTRLYTSIDIIEFSKNAGYDQPTNWFRVVTNRSDRSLSNIFISQRIEGTILWKIRTQLIGAWN